MWTAAVLPLVCFALACVAERGPLRNRMAQSGTHYLSRAADEPVSWQPWGREAFVLAARLDRPILLYVGAEDCRWCVVMDREVYADHALGALIDSLFVPVRVDWDERPDVAQRYQPAVQSLAGLRGLPLTVFLTSDGSAFFGGTYFPADDPFTGRGLRQVLPEVARSYREQRAFIVRQTALVRELARRKSTTAHGVLRPQAMRAEIEAVRAVLEAGVRARAVLGSFVHTQAVGLVLAEYGRSTDTAYLALARAALDFMTDSTAGASSAWVGEDPPELVRAGLLRDLARAWALTRAPRYRDLGRVLLARLVRDLERKREAERAGFADQEAYVIASVLEAAPALREADSGIESRALAALDTLLARVYRRGQGVRHAVRASVHLLLQDQVQVAAACLVAHGLTGDARYLAVTQDIAGVLERDFADSTGGYFDAAAADPAAPALAERTKHVLDDRLPGANAGAAWVLLQLAGATGDARYRQRAQTTLEAFAGAMAGEALRASSYLAAARELVATRSAVPGRR